MVSYNSVGVRRHNEMCGLILASLEQKRIAHSRGDAYLYSYRNTAYFIQ